MTLEDFVLFFREELGIDVYPIQFPLTNPVEDCVVIDVVGGDCGVVSTVSIQVNARSTHPKMAENLLGEVIKKLNKLTNRVYNNTQIILIKSDVTHPYFLGQDETGKFLYSTRFRVLISEN